MQKLKLHSRTVRPYGGCPAGHWTQTVPCHVCTATGPVVKAQPAIRSQYTPNPLAVSWIDQLLGARNLKSE